MVFLRNKIYKKNERQIYTISTYFKFGFWF